jgi:hypothetical protein
VSTVIIAATTSAAKTIASASGAIGLRFCLIDGQGSAPQVGSIERCDRLVSLIGISHFDKPETTGLACFAVGHESDFLNRSVCFEDGSQLGFGRAVG